MASRSGRDELPGSTGDVQLGLDHIEHHWGILVFVDQDHSITVDHGCRVTSDCCPCGEVVQVKEPTSEMVGQLAQECRLAYLAGALQQHDGTLLLALRAMSSIRREIRRLVSFTSPSHD